MTFLPRSPLTLPEPPEAPARGPRPPRRWRHKFGDAFRGLKLGIRGHSSFFVHFFFAALVVAAAIVLRCDLLQWCLLLGCIGMVLTAELFNSAIETLFRGLDEQTKARAWPCLDIAAGAVLLASITAVVIGSLVFLKQLGDLLM
jgi:diacylglycerol kinase